MTDSNANAGICPACLQKMVLLRPQHYRCDICKNEYQEQYICPTCEQIAKTISGCGAINYLCKTDGLISSRKIKYHYLVK